MYAIRSYYGWTFNKMFRDVFNRYHKTNGNSCSGISSQLHLVCTKGVITSYSIHYTKLYEDTITALFSVWNPEVVLNGHSGGGRFIFSYIEAVGEIPENVKRIAFLDSNYGYEDTLHAAPLTNWLKSGDDKFLTVLAYNA